ncbi:hypothetical protein Nepgr_021842 [Nepenthes gracilis]|uniref:SMP domain-containing protein n=1 Tax=Nepenthes gracilis TaxID=150966 RepID=A0AAD3T1J9_NEPGR|nr:hypothetical protein Nepgr_021842 [Nepenthes gracilis]
MQSAEAMAYGQTQKGGSAAVMQSAADINERIGLVGHLDGSYVTEELGFTVTEVDVIIPESVGGQLKENAEMSSSSSFSFLQGAFTSSQQLPIPQKLEISRLQTLSVIDSKARTRRRDHAARHSRIRKKYPRCNCDEERIWSIKNILECQTAVLPCGQDRSWTVEEVDIIEVVADQMAMDISHAAVLEDSQLMRDKLEDQNHAWQRAKKNGIRLAK